jgi:hypothetical protein
VKTVYLYYQERGKKEDAPEQNLKASTKSEERALEREQEHEKIRKENRRVSFIHPASICSALHQL